jgi:hypothetical protein
MAATLGKRKRVSREELQRPSQSSSPSSGSANSDAEDLQAIFRRAFEAKFKPLPKEPKKQKIVEALEEEKQEQEEESDWSGISDEEDDVQVIEHTDSWLDLDDTSKAEMRAFMSSKPPKTIPTSSKSLTAKKDSEDGELNESTNLKNDLDLQKLLRESHLLSASVTSSGTAKTTLSATGIARHKSTDLHLQSLGAKASVFAQKKMPMAQRKHESQKARLSEEKRRAEAKESGIVLERPTMGRKGGIQKRERGERGVGLPGVGKFKGGTLSLSKKDVRSITGGPGKAKGKGKKGKR